MEKHFDEQGRCRKTTCAEPSAKPAKPLGIMESLHELREESVVKEYLTTAADGKSYRVLHYNLDVIISAAEPTPSPVTSTRFPIGLFLIFSEKPLKSVQTLL